MASSNGTRHPRFSAAAGRAMRYAATEAARLSPREVTSVHVLLGLVHARDSVAGTLAAEVALTTGPLWGTIELSTGGTIARMPARHAALWALRPRWTDGARDALADAEATALDRGSDTVDTGDILSALFYSKGRAARILRRNGFDADTIDARVARARREVGENVQPTRRVQTGRAHLAWACLRVP